MNKGKSIIKIVSAGIIIFIILCVINRIPAWNLKTKNMHVIEGDWVKVYYEEQASAAKDVFELAEGGAEEIAKKLGFRSKQDINIYIYDEQRTMQTKKYGLIARLLKLDWYIGDNIGTNIILTSPANPGTVHDYNSIKFTVLHEMIHGYTSILNPTLHLWLKEGLALYLSNGEPFHKSYLESNQIPCYSKIQTKNPVSFANMGGYQLSHIYIEYLDCTYGWDKVLELIKTEDYRKVFGVSQKIIYNNWIDYLEHYH